MTCGEDAGPRRDRARIGAGDAAPAARPHDSGGAWAPPESYWWGPSGGQLVLVRTAESDDRAREAVGALALALDALVLAGALGELPGADDVGALEVAGEQDRGGPAL